MKHFLFLILIIFTHSLFSQSIFYVMQNGTGNGESWEKASNNLSLILKNAKSGDEIRVAEGTYKPTDGNDRTASFFIPDGVRLIGGFKGFERQIQQRKAADKPTVLSGEIGNPGTGDNSYSVVTMINAGAGTLIDGFEIRGGNANSDEGVGSPNSSGGGLYLAVKDGHSSPIIRNTIFIENYAKTGGALFNVSKAGSAHAKFFNCFFISNEAKFAGGAIYNSALTNGILKTEFEMCVLENNSADYGGAVCNFSDMGVCKPAISQSKIRNNTANYEGGFIRNLKKSGGVLPTVEFCTVENNRIKTQKKEGIALLISDQK